MLGHAVGKRRLRFPLLASPKLDGMRVSLSERGPVTKSLRPLPNERLREYLSRPALMGLDGELVFGDPVAPDVVQRSIAAGMARRGPGPEAGLSFWVFDSFTASDAPFRERYAAAERIVRRARLKHLVMAPVFPADSIEELERIESEIVARGFEGVVIRDPGAPYVFGRLPPKSQAVLKWKRRTDLVGVVVDAIKRGGRVDALLVAHPDWPAPFELPLHGRTPREPIGRRVRFSRHPGSWKGAPRSPLFVRLEP